MSNRPGTVFVATIVAGFAVVASATADPGRPRAVVELFTSQGCGKCPPADALLTTLSADPTLITLSYAVDYWDYLGWKDTAARPEFTRRQRAYAAARGDNSVYTPQMVINGRAHVVGSDRAAVERTLAEQQRAAEAPSVAIDGEVSGDTLIVRIADAPADLAVARATVWLARYEPLRTVPIPKGENSGRTVTYTHRVKALQPIGMWKGKALRIELPHAEKDEVAGEGCVVLLQAEGENGPGAVIGARDLDRPHS